DVRRVTQREDSVRRDVLPLGAQLAKLPVPPGLATVGRQPPPVPHRAVPDFAPRPEPERVHEIPGDAVSRGIVGMTELLPVARSRPQHEDALPVGPHPDRAVRPAGQGQHMNPPPRGIRQGRNVLCPERRRNTYGPYGHTAHPTIRHVAILAAHRLSAPTESPSHRLSAAASPPTAPPPRHPRRAACPCAW